MRVLLIIFLLAMIAPQPAFAQFNKKLDSLCVVCDRSSSDSEKIMALGKLATHYYLFRLNSKGDSVLREQLLIAEVSSNQDLILAALFDDAILNISPNTGKESFNKTLDFAQKGINYAKAINNYDFLAVGYIRMSALLRKIGDNDRALLNCVSALSLFQNITSDSIKARVYLELGDTYMARSDAVTACGNYNRAYDLAVKSNSVPLQSRVHHRVAEMFKSLGDEEQAKIELNKSLALNREAGNRRGVMLDYFDLARLTSEKYFIEKSAFLADSLGDFGQLLNSRRLMFVYYYVVEKDAQTAFRYLNSEVDLRESYLNEGDDNYFTTIANVHFYSGNIDSATVYYKKAERATTENVEKGLMKFIFAQLGECARLKQDYMSSIGYYNRALAVSAELKEPASIASYSAKLSELYGAAKDYKNAFALSKESIRYTDSLRKLSKQNELALMGVARETRKHEQELLQLHQNEIAKRNIQFMGITIVLVILFFVMLFVGSYPVAPLTVKLMGYFFFISLFEFVTLIIDNFFLDSSLHTQPWKWWLIKIAVIAALVPFQQLLERSVMKLLISRKLVEARTHFSLRKWWTRINRKTAPVATLNQDQAVM